MHVRNGSWLFGLSTACQRKTPEVALQTPSVLRRLGEGKSQNGTVTFKGAKLEVETQEDSLQQTEEQVKKDIYNGVEQVLGASSRSQRFDSDLRVFIEYEYGTDDKRNTLYLTEE